MHFNTLEEPSPVAEPSVPPSPQTEEDLVREENRKCRLRYFNEAIEQGTKEDSSPTTNISSEKRKLSDAPLPHPHSHPNPSDCPTSSFSSFGRHKGSIGKGMLSLEYSDCGTGDFRNPSFYVICHNGSTITPLRYKHHVILPGK